MSVKSEKYKSKKVMKKHEKSEGAKERMMEYGKKAGKHKMPNGKMMKNSSMKKMGKKK
jgi:hypothetical protein